MKINLRGNRVAIEKNKKAKKGGGDGFIIVPEGDEYMGKITHVGEDVKGLEVGQTVYFTTNHQNVRMGGVDLCIMEEKEVYAVLQ